ncbi:MAG: TonB-dependent receptor, partial [Candidatus Zixiibacteriota bacterium]
VINIFPDTASFGTNVSGPTYTSSEFQFIQNNQAGGAPEFANFRFNQNGIYDNLEGEAFLDLNGNGVWDRGDRLNDKNGNGRLDENRLDRINNHTPEPYIDGDSVLGEPFTDLNANGIYEPGIDAFVMSADPTINQDLNHDGTHNGPEDGWTPGIPFFDRNGNGIYDPPNNQYDPGEPFTDVNGNGKYDRGGSGTFLDPLNYDTDARWASQFTKTYRGEIKVFRQMGNHELKAGFALKRDELRNQEIIQPYQRYNGRFDGGPYPDRGAFRDFYSYQPWSGTVYFRDKLEYGSMIASLGLRWDFFLQDVNELIKTLKADDRGGTIQGDRQHLSPRIGFSYPISDKAKVYFNYGHFYQLPGLTSMYARNTSSSDQNAVLGNPNLDYAKTIQYSFGVKYAMTENYAVDIEGYFKDEFDKVVQTRFQTSTGLIRNRFDNGDYGRGRGIEITIDKTGGGYVTGEVSYTYAFSNGKASEARQKALSAFEFQREPLTEAPLDNDIRHSLKSTITVFIPKTVKPRLFGVPILNGWSMSLESIIESGAPFTPASTFPGIDQTTQEDIERNSLRMPATARFDVRFNKEFEMAGLDWSFILWVENVFNRRNVVFVYPATGRADTQQNQNKVILGGTDFDANPYFWDRGRQIRVGLELTL